MEDLKQVKQWKKQKDIKGVSAASIMELKGTLYQTAQDVKRAKQTGEKRAKQVVSKKTADLYTVNKQNKGVKSRAEKDEIAYAEDQKTWEVAEARLKAKSELYSKMGKVSIETLEILNIEVKGDMLDLQQNFEDEKGYLVDFERKNWEKDDSSDSDREDRKRRSREELEEEELRAEEERRRRQRVVFSLESETKKGRKKHLELKERKKREAAERMQKLRIKELQRQTMLEAREATQDEESNNT